MACAAARQASEVELRRRIAEHDASLLDRFDLLLTWAHFWTPALDNRFGVGGPLALRLLDVIRQTGTMLVQEGLLDDPIDLFLLTPDDLALIAKTEDVSQYRPLFLSRQREFEHNRRLVPPPFLGRPSEPAATEEVPKPEILVDKRQQISSTRNFQGDGLAPGQVMGIVRKIVDLSDTASLDSLTSESILVYPGFYTWPDWLSLLMVVKGLVTVQGSQLHHATQLARECGVPYINLTQEDWDSIPDNVNVALDGKTGMVTLL